MSVWKNHKNHRRKVNITIGTFDKLEINYFQPFLTSESMEVAVYVWKL